jgi:hypothetical protein
MAQKDTPRWKRYLRAHKAAYIDKTKTAGGFKQAWKMALHRDLQASSDATGKEAVIELALIAADGVWEQTTAPTEDGQRSFLFTVAGRGVEEFYNFPDASVPGGYRRVSGLYATPWHVEQAAEIKRIKADQSVAAWRTAVDDAAAFLARCGGDRHAVIWDFRDGMAGGGSQPEMPSPAP